MVYPVCVHFLIAQLVAECFFGYLINIKGYSIETYYRYVTDATGVTALLMMLPAAYWYRKDSACRRIGGLTDEKSQKTGFLRGLLYLLLGAAAAQYANILVNFFSSVLQPSASAYYESLDRITEGKSLLILILWMGVVAPVMEEMVFRWVIYLRLRDWMRVPAAMLISAVVFGIYHGNLIQGIYAAIMGVLMAFVLEMTGSLVSSILIHIGANTWVVLFSFYGMGLLEDETVLLGIFAVFLASLLLGIPYLYRKYKKTGQRMV